MDRVCVFRPTGEGITTKESGVKAGTKLKSLFPLLISRFTVQDWLAILYIICVLFAHAVLSREIGKGFGPLCSSISFSHDTSAG
jgi:hypothetical protein